MRKAIAAVVALTLLAGCSSKSGGGSNSSSSAAAGEQQTQEPDNLTTDQGNIATPMAPPSPSPIAGIPAVFQGRWGLVANDCDPAQATAAKGLMTVTGNRLSFYESRGTPAHLRQLTPAAIVFDLPMSGEGQSWSEPTRLTLQDDGRTLVRQATGSPDRAGAFTYQRCPS